jgi:hypothetical protein
LGTLWSSELLSWLPPVPPNSDSSPTLLQIALILHRVRDDDKTFTPLALELNSAREQLGHKMTAVTPCLACGIIRIRTLHSTPSPEIENDY